MRLLILFVVAALFLRGGALIADDSADSLAPLVDILKDSDDAELQLDMLKGMSDALKGRTDLKMPKGWPEVSARLAKSPSADVRNLAQSLSALFGDKSSMTAARKTAADVKAPADDRRRALATLVDAKQPDLAPFLREMLADAILRPQALRGLAGYDDVQTPAAILAIFKNLPVPEKLDALNTLAARENYALALLKGLDDKALQKADLSAAIVRQLASYNHDDINKWIKDNWGAVRTSSDEKLADMARIKQMVLSSRPEEFNLSRGRLVFSKTCQQCHILYDEGGKVGPDLTGSGRADLDYLMQNIVDPSAVVGKDYLVWSMKTKKKRIISGIIKAEDDNTITVQSENEQIIVAKRDLDRPPKASEFSMMPEGQLQALTRQEVLDLIAYLRSPKQAPLSQP